MCKQPQLTGRSRGEFCAGKDSLGEKFYLQLCSEELVLVGLRTVHAVPGNYENAQQ
jgi:hypothetical protein